jgi:hypothetical protein
MVKRVAAQSWSELEAIAETLETFRVGDQIICKGQLQINVAKMNVRLEAYAGSKLKEKLIPYLKT